MKRVLAMVLQPFSYLFIFSLFIFFLLPGAIIALPFTRPVRSKMNAPFWKAFSWLSVHVGVLAKPYIRDERDTADQKSYPPAGLYIANHSSLVDVPLVITKVPIPPIMKKEVLYIPILGICGYSAGAMIVDRKDKDSRKKVFEQAKERLTTGIKTLMFYPEGTRNRKADHPKEFQEIKKPILRFAFEQGIPVHCISVFGTKKVLSPNSLKLNYGKKVGMIIRRPMNPSEFQDSEEFIQACWKQVQDGYAELQEKLT